MNIDLITTNLLSPMVLAFGLGLLAKAIKSDLKLPAGLYTSLSIYLLFAIGLKGGVALSKTNPAEILNPALVTLVLGFLTAIIAYLAARKVGKINKIDSASLAAHFGSVSAVTFIAAETFAVSQGIKPEGFMAALVAVLEIPAILFAVGYLGKQKGANTFKDVAKELATSKTVVLLVGGMIIGMLTGTQGMDQVKPLFGDLFKGALTIFLLEMGLVAGSHLADLKRHAVFLPLYGTIVPIINGTLGVFLGTFAGLNPGGAGILGAMAASASYIAAPAAVRIALPQANPSLYLTAALAVTFPFNLTIGIPLFQTIANSIVK